MSAVSWLQRARLPYSIAAALLVASSVSAAPLVPGPGQPAHDEVLAAKLARFERQIHGITAVSLGWGLEAYIADPGARDQIAAFVASDAESFEDFSGQHVYTVVDQYEEFGDLGMFGGVQAAGDAFRYAALRDEGADAAELDAAREHLLAAMDGLHWYSRVTGTPGVIARGLRRKLPQPGAPALPGTLPETLPLFDENGEPLPVDKSPTWRDDVSGELPELVWFDDTSKDQFIGYVFALGVVYDTVVDDDSIPPEAIERLVEDARALAQSLMQERQIGEATIDLVLMDADGRPTSFHDVAAEELTPGLVSGAAVNPFNAIMALGAMRTLYQITGDADIGEFYYDGLIDDRGYLELASQSLGLLYFDHATNYSNVNMAFVAIYGMLRYEPDADIAAVVRELLESQLYSADLDNSARGLGQTFFDFMVAGFATDGTTGIGGNAFVDGLVTLRDHPDAPYWDPLVENCDADELAAGSCLAIDGSTITIADAPGWGGGLVAEDPLPMAIRPPSNFTWRSNPHSMNGGGSTRLNPGGEIHCAYWMGRVLLAGADGFANISAHARGRPDEPMPPDDTTSGTGDADEGSSAAGPSEDSGAHTTDVASTTGADASPADGAAQGCGCALAPDSSWGLTGLLALAAAIRRRRD